MNEAQLHAILVPIVLEDEKNLLLFPCLISEEERKRRLHPENQKVFGVTSRQELDAVVEGATEPSDIYKILCEKCWTQQWCVTDFEIVWRDADLPK